MKAIRGPTMQHIVFYYANYLANQLRDDLLSQNIEMLIMLQEMTADVPANEENTTPSTYIIHQCDESGQYSSRNNTLAMRYSTQHEAA